MERLNMSMGKIGQKAWNKGLSSSPEHVEKMRQRIQEQYKNGRVPWNKGKKGVQVSSRKGKSFPQGAGEKHWNWKGGRSELWYRKLMEAAGIEKKCVTCGSIEKIHIHHKNGDHHDNRIENMEYRCNDHHVPLMHKNRRPTGGSWKAGNEPWNKGVKGVVQPNSGSFQKGQLVWWQKLGYSSVRAAMAARKKENKK